MKTYTYNDFLREQWVIKLTEYIITDCIKYNMDNSYYTLEINNTDRFGDINTAVTKIVDTLGLSAGEIGMLNVKAEHYLKCLLEWGTVWFSFNFETKQFDIKQSVTDEDKLKYSISMLFDNKSYFERMYFETLNYLNEFPQLFSFSSYNSPEQFKYYEAMKIMSNIPLEYFNADMTINESNTITDTMLFYIIEQSLNDIIKKPLMSKFNEDDFSLKLNKESNIKNEYKNIEERFNNHMKNISKGYDV